jgi:bacterioferritin-associated ferredoxin
MNTEDTDKHGTGYLSGQHGATRRDVAVNRCICRDVTFESALAIAQARGFGSVRQLRDASPLGSGCGLCIPYMQRALMTGETDLPVLEEPERLRLVELSEVTPESGE